MNHSSRFLHHGVLLIVLHQVCERVKPLSSPDIILPVWLQDRMTKPQGDSNARLPAGSPTQRLSQGQCISHLVVDHHMGHVWLPVPSLHLILICQHRQHKVSRFALAFSHQKATWFPLLCQKLLCLLASEVPMVPPREQQWRARSAQKRTQCCL